MISVYKVVTNDFYCVYSLLTCLCMGMRNTWWKRAQTIEIPSIKITQGKIRQIYSAEHKLSPTWFESLKFSRFLWLAAMGQIFDFFFSFLAKCKTKLRMQPFENMVLTSFPHKIYGCITFSSPHKMSNKRRIYCRLDDVVKGRVKQNCPNCTQWDQLQTWPRETWEPSHLAQILCLYSPAGAGVKIQTWRLVTNAWVARLNECVIWPRWLPVCVAFARIYRHHLNISSFLAAPQQQSNSSAKKDRMNESPTNHYPFEHNDIKKFAYFYAEKGSFCPWTV